MLDLAEDYYQERPAGYPAAAFSLEAGHHSGPAGLSADRLGAETPQPALVAGPGVCGQIRESTADAAQPQGSEANNGAGTQKQITSGFTGTGRCRPRISIQRAATELDIAIIGGGSAGISLAAQLKNRSAVVIEPRTPAERDCSWALWANPAQQQQFASVSQRQLATVATDRSSHRGAPPD